jgi:hypothetical protein
MDGSNRRAGMKPSEIKKFDIRKEEGHFMNPIDIGSRLELFVDHHLIDALHNTTLRLHEPHKMPLAKHPFAGGYATVIKEDGLYRAYYRDMLSDYEGEGEDGNPGELYRYAESRDGHEWTYPELGIHDLNDGGKNNICLYGDTPCTHNLSPFLDTRPGVDESERFKALAGVYWTGLYMFVSSDGRHWRQAQEKPVIPTEFKEDNGLYMFDSQNVSFWSKAENCYVCYFRTLVTPHGRFRSVSRMTSDDYIHWKNRQDLQPNDPDEHLYTSQTHPYFRAPHLYIATPTRFVADRGDSTEILFMSKRAGAASYDRLFKEAWIRPGLDPARWGNRSNYAALNVVPTGAGEMSLYHASSGYRYVLRTDGFVSVNASYEGGEMVTKPFVFEGSKLVMNYSTAATGSIRVEIQDVDGTPVPKFEIKACPEIVGDAIEQAVVWEGGNDVERLAGQPVRLRFVMRDADLYSVQFR